MFKRRVRAPLSVFGCLLKADAAGWRLGPSCANQERHIVRPPCRPLNLHIKGNKELRPHCLDDGVDAEAGDGASGVGIQGLYTKTCCWLVQWRLPSINPI